MKEIREGHPGLVWLLAKLYVHARLQACPPKMMFSTRVAIQDEYSPWAEMVIVFHRFYTQMHVTGSMGFNSNRVEI